MPPAKKLQVFVSSTYTDLREERQAAVEAILTAGHIPAGMELFTAGDESQMDVIRRWIDESDVFLLILGGRYGSLEHVSGKSYTHLEYEYAIEREKPLFAVVINEIALEERVKSAGTNAIEIENSAQLREFRRIVLSKMVRFWSDLRDIKLAIHETMSEFGRRSDLTGWVPGDQAVSGGLLAEEIARLTKENAEFRQRLNESGRHSAAYHGLSFDDFSNLLRSERLDFSDIEQQKLKKITDDVGASATLLELLWSLRNEMFPGGFIDWNDPQFRIMKRLNIYGLMQFWSEDPVQGTSAFQLTGEGRKFLLRLLAERQSAVDES
jgi:hypothetical protein